MQREREWERRRTSFLTRYVLTQLTRVLRQGKIKEKEGPFVSAFLELGPRLYLTESRRLF